MSTFLGVSCLRSSPSLAGALRSRAHISCAPSSGALLEGLAGSVRSFSIWSNSRASHNRKSALISAQLLQPQCRSPPAPNNHQRRSLFGLSSSTVITEYVHLPAEYKDETGIPFGESDSLTKSDVSIIFPGSKITPSLATKLLKIMHGRRVAGTLDDPALRVNTAMFHQTDIIKALEYLRREVPVDEILNAGLRAEDELRELEAGMAAEEATSKESESEAQGSTTPKDESPRSVYGESILDRLRAANIARAEAEEKAEAEQRKKEEEAAAHVWGGLTAYDPSLHRGLDPKQLEHYNAATSDLEAPPDTPRWRVLLPTTAFAVALLAGLYLAVTVIAPPRPGSDLETKIAIGALAAVNLGVFIAWKRVRLWKFLNQHFILDFVTPRPHQIFTAMLTHQDARHLFKTLVTMMIGGSLLVPEVGPLPFFATYVASGVCGFLATLYTFAARGKMVYMFGASSAGFGVACAYFWLYRFDGFKVLGLPPDPYSGIQGLGFIGLIMAFFALVPMVRKQGGNADWTSHLVGMLTGVGCAAIMEQRWKHGKALSAPLEEPVRVVAESRPKA